MGSSSDLDHKLQVGLRWIHRMRDHRMPLAVDTETTSLNVGGDAVTIGVSISCGTLDLYVPFHHLTGQNANIETREMLAWTLENWRGPVVFANVLFDLLALEDLGIQMEGRDLWDVILMAHLIDENTPKSKSLEELAKHYVDPELKKVSTPFIDGQKQIGWPDTTWEQMWPYATVDTRLTLKVYEALYPKLLNEIPLDLWPHKQRLFLVLLAMRRYGVRIDTMLARSHVAQAVHEMGLAKAELQIEGTLGPKALQQLIHEQLGVPVLHKTRTDKPSFDKTAMADYEVELERMESPIAHALKTYRGWQKASSASSIPYLNLMDSDGRLRCSYKMHGTVTGRLSCEQPNLQQIPKAGDKPWNGTIKQQFIAEDGYTLLNADFSQLELRLGTAYAGEEALKQVFEEGRDIFDEMAAELGWDRPKTKTFVYATNYGAGYRKHMSAFHISEREAKKMIADYRRAYPKLSRTADKVAREAERRGSIRLWSNRRRRFQYPSESYKAWNALIQGGAADLVERCLVRCYETLHDDSCRMLLQVHDSITWEVRNERVAEMMPRIKATMEDVTGYTGTDFGVKFAVDVDFWSTREEQNYGAYQQGALPRPR